MADFSDLERTVLIESLGALHGLFWPLRFPWAHNWAAVHWRRQHYSQIGMPLSGTDDRQRSTAIRALTKAGLVQPVRGTLKVSGLSLTPAGIVVAERLAGFGGNEAIVFALELERLGGDDWVPETDLADSPDRAELRIVELTALCALGRGLAESNSTAQGHVAYRRTAMQLPAETDDPGPGNDLAPEYDAAVESAIRWLDSKGGRADAPPNEIGAIPLAMDVFRERIRA